MKTLSLLLVVTMLSCAAPAAAQDAAQPVPDVAHLFTDTVRVGRFVVAPAVGPGTVGASFTWVGTP
jgi:hypothetical protein